VLITFEVSGTAAEFRWNRITGTAVLTVGEDQIQLQSPWRPSTHWRARTTRTWQHQAHGHEIAILKVRPLFLAPFRENHFTIKVDGDVVAEASGH
jgi:hypothetical protein